MLLYLHNIDILDAIYVLLKNLSNCRFQQVALGSEDLQIVGRSSQLNRILLESPY